MTVILAPAIAVLFALSRQMDRQRWELTTAKTAWLQQQEELSQWQNQESNLTATVRELNHGLRGWSGPAAIDPAMADFLRTNEVRTASSGMVDKILARLRAEGTSSGKYVLVSKASLKNSRMPLLQAFPSGSKLTALARGVLAVTPEEQPAVESAFAEALGAVADWARANVTRDGPANNMLVRYTIPADVMFDQVVSNQLFSALDAAVGRERTELMNLNFQYGRIYEDGYIAGRTNILEIHSLPGKSVLGYRDGWKWENFSSVITDPEPIKSNRFPAAFRFIFPGGWKDLAQREGWEDRKEFGE